MSLPAFLEPLFIEAAIQSAVAKAITAHLVSLETRKLYLGDGRELAELLARMIAKQITRRMHASAKDGGTNE